MENEELQAAREELERQMSEAEAEIAEQAAALEKVTRPNLTFANFMAIPADAFKLVWWGSSVQGKEMARVSAVRR